MTIPIPLQPGDHLLYGVKDFFGFITSLKTWSPAVHIEIYAGDGLSVASRNGLGVNKYLLRSEQLIAVLRPNQPMNIAAGLKWFSQEYSIFTHQGVRKRPYGWLDLLRFCNLKFKTDGWICSQFAAYFDGACGFHPFAPGYYQGSIDPGDYFISPHFDWAWISKAAALALAP